MGPVRLPGGGRVHQIAAVDGRWYVAGSADALTTRVLTRWWSAATLDGPWRRGALVTQYADGRRARLPASEIDEQIGEHWASLARTQERRAGLAPPRVPRTPRAAVRAGEMPATLRSGH